MKQYFYQFSQGSYSDYGVGGLFSCDHEVTEEEWDNCYKVFSDECLRLTKLIPTDPSNSWRRIYDSDEMRAYTAYRAQCPEEAFQKLHNMVAVPCVELWWD